MPIPMTYVMGYCYIAPDGAMARSGFHDLEPALNIFCHKMSARGVCHIEQENFGASFEPADFILRR
jgi:hypothetical protein